jgi:5-methylcytosine-specific restriction endonuclease McrA
MTPDGGTLGWMNWPGRLAADAVGTAGGVAMSVGTGTGSSISTVVRVNVCVHGHRVYDVDCGSCRRLNSDPRRRPHGLRRRHLAAVAAREGYRCGLCGDPVDMAVPLDDGRAITLDQVIPRAHGGSDHRDNLQLAHRDCNQAKADALTIEQRTVNLPRPNAEQHGPRGVEGSSSRACAPRSARDGRLRRHVVRPPVRAGPDGGASRRWEPGLRRRAEGAAGASTTLDAIFLILLFLLVSATRPANLQEGASLQSL